MDLSGRPAFGYEKLEGKKNTKERMEEKHGIEFAASLHPFKLSVLEEATTMTVLT